MSIDVQAEAIVERPRAEVEDEGDGTRARIRIEGDAAGFYRLASQVLARAARRSIARDLRSLRDLLESKAAGR